MINNFIQKQKIVYKENFIKEGPSPKGLLWNNTQSQYLRFERIINNFIPLSKKVTIHDVGCGICDFHKFLLSKQIEHVYSGTEIVREMIDYSLIKYPYIQICYRNLLSAPTSEKYDIVVLSGTLNLLANIPYKDWHEYAFELIKKMYEMSETGISFNFLTTYKTFTEPGLFYLDPLEVFDFCTKNLSRFVNLDHSYPLYEATITIYRKDYIKNKHLEIEFEKYF